MLRSPQVGQIVRLDNYKETLIVKAVSDNGGISDPVPECEPDYIRKYVADKPVRIEAHSIEIEFHQNGTARCGS
jgi:hypothetical protein